MRKPVSPFGLAFGLSLAFVCCAMARPATAKDLAGRTICFNTGEKVKYYRDGREENNAVGNGTYKVTSVGVQIDDEKFHGLLDFEVQPDRSIVIVGHNMIGNDCK